MLTDEPRKTLRRVGLNEKSGETPDEVGVTTGEGGNRPNAERDQTDGMKRRGRRESIRPQHIWGLRILS